MQIEIFTICDSAQVYAGKAVITGSFNQITVKQLPVVLSNFTIAVRIAFEKEESGDKTFYFYLKNPDGSLLFPELKCEAKQNIPAEKRDPIITYDLNLVLGSVMFKQFGTYTVTMRLDDKDYMLKFFVQEETK